MFNHWLKAGVLAWLALALTVGFGAHMHALQQQAAGARMAMVPSDVAASPDAASHHPDGDQQRTCTGSCVCTPYAGVLEQRPVLAALRLESGLQATTFSTLDRTVSPELHPPRS
ncbi:MAG: hypothetical protein HY423_10570 [Candidatus Lambdaproteobacteria bacterium]|nr:hypothetical protein [Candidatus Lambdaproteobacteria bacterium]